MAYVPPHKRLSAGKGDAPTPESMAIGLRRTLNFQPNSGSNHRKWFPRVYYSNAPSATLKWFPVGLGSCFGYSDNDADKFMSFTKLEPVFAQDTDLRSKSRALILDHDRIKEYDGERGIVLENPWDFISEKVKKDLVSAMQRVQEKMKDDDDELIKPTLVARLGRLVFKGDSSSLSNLKRVFDTNVSPTIVEHVVDEVFPKFRNGAELQKEYYVVRLFNRSEPKSTISCKCIPAKDGQTVELYKIELIKERFFISDMACLGKNVDLRLIMVTKTADKLTDDEMENVRSVIGSAVVDPQVKGGLRWPLGSGNKYTVNAAWHVNTRIVEDSSLKLKVRSSSDRFNFGSSLGEVSTEVCMRIMNVMSTLQMQPMPEDLLTETLRDMLKLIWDNFVCSPSTI